MKSQPEIADFTVSTLGFYINRALSAMIRNLNKELKAAGLDIQHSHFVVLKFLSVKDSVCQSEISYISGKDKAAISRTLAYLEKNNYVVREAQNKCKYSVVLTDKGREIIPLINDIADKVTSKAFTGFRNGAKIRVIEDLTKIYSNFL